MKMEHTILVPIDGTESADETLLYVRSISPKSETRIVLVHVTPHVDAANAVIEIHHNVNAIHDVLAHEGWKVERETRMGDPVREILDKIDAMKIDLVSMASHGDGGERRAMDESVTAEVVRHSNCPLLVWSAEPQCPSVIK
jgi:nucleotide-binding universal stress UspA family protein